MRFNGRHHRLLGLFLSSFVMIPLFLSAPAHAQQYAPNEITVGVDLQTFGIQTCTPIGSTPFCQPGTDHDFAYSTPSISYTRNLSPSLALEGTVLPATSFMHTNGFGSGSQMLALGGVKTGWRGKRWGFYGKVQVGIASYSCGTFDYDPTPYSDCARLTNFALEYGGVAEYRLTRRWALRVDAAHLLMPEFDQILEQGENFTVAREGAILQHLDSRVGITHSFGALREAQPETVPGYAAWDVGALFALQPRIMPDYTYMNAYPTWGLWDSWNFSRHASWDSALLHSGRNSGPFTFSDYQAGGRAFQALTGLKVGIRRDRMGYFGKLRGGTITFGETERQIGILPSGAVLDRGMFTSPVLDVGGVLEVYPSHHSILRFDAGSATIFYQPKNIIQTVNQTSETIAIPGQTQTTILMSFGAGFRF
jgi:hypothetical protein